MQQRLIALLTRLHRARSTSDETKYLAEIDQFFEDNKADKAKDYLHKYYLSTPELRAHWVHAYRQDLPAPQALSDTNNIAESVFRTTKVVKLDYRGNKRIDSLHVFILHDLLPHFTQVLLDGSRGNGVNFSKLLSEADMLHELANAIRKKENAVQAVDQPAGIYSVVSAGQNSAIYYTVDLAQLTCTCLNKNIDSLLLCHHIRAAVYVDEVATRRRSAETWKFSFTGFAQLDRRGPDISQPLVGAESVANGAIDHVDDQDVVEPMDEDGPAAEAGPGAGSPAAASGSAPASPGLQRPSGRSDDVDYSALYEFQQWASRTLRPEAFPDMFSSKKTQKATWRAIMYDAGQRATALQRSDVKLPAVTASSRSRPKRLIADDEVALDDVASDQGDDRNAALLTPVTVPDEHARPARKRQGAGSRRSFRGST